MRLSSTENALLRLQWLRERAKMLRYTYVAHLVFFGYPSYNTLHRLFFLQFKC